MKKVILALAMLTTFCGFSRQNAETDSISASLNEIQVTADKQVETANKVIINPSKQDKEHSTNGYVLLANLNLPDFNVCPAEQKITTITGKDVQILVNGVEISANELGALAASEIVQIDYQRNPGGKWVGSGAVINFITVQYEYGGNVYISADEGLARQYGNYTGMANYKKGAVTLTLTASGKWENSSILNNADNTAILADGVLHQNINSLEASTHNNSQYLKFKFSHAANNHSLDISTLFKRNATPRNLFNNKMVYTGLYDFSSDVEMNSHERGILPAFGLKYNLFIPGGHTLMISSEVSHGHTNYKSMRTETGFDRIANNAIENNYKIGGNISYFKTMRQNLSLGATIDEYYNYFRDCYTGSFESKQTLTNSNTMLMLHINHNLRSNISYYASIGVTNLYSTIGEHNDNQISPIVFYGANYAINQKHAVSVTGNYSHSIYNPSYKNEAVIQTSFFESTIGNPDLGQLKAFQNMISYNGRVGFFGLSFAYDFLKYFDNTSNRYFTDGNTMCHQLVNDGNFQYNKLIFGLSANLFNSKLRIKGSAIYSANRFDSEYRPSKSKDWRADFVASYVFGDWQIKGVYALPYKVLGIEGTKLHNPAQYGLSVNWQHGKWSVECNVENFLDRRLGTRTDADYGVYKSYSQSFSDLKGRNIGVTVTYILPYGKKTDSEKVNTDSKINSAILRPF